MIRVCTVCLKYRKYGLNEIILSPLLLTIFSAYTLTHQYCQYFGYTCFLLQVFFVILVVSTVLLYGLYEIFNSKLYRRSLVDLLNESYTGIYQQTHAFLWPRDNAVFSWTEEKPLASAARDIYGNITRVRHKPSMMYKGTLQHVSSLMNVSMLSYSNIDTQFRHKESLPVHERSEQTCGSKKFLVFLCSKQQMCGGWGDRQKGIISTYLMALLTNRTFVIVSTNPCNLNTFLVPNTYNWTMCHKYIMSLPKSETKTMNLVDPDHDILFEDSESGMRLRDVFRHKVVYIRTNRIWNKQILSQSEAAQRIPWAVGKTIAEISGIVLSRLFRPIESLEKEINRFISNNTGNRSMICSHIRVGKNPSMPNDNRRRFGVPNITAIFEFLRKFDNPSKYVIYVATDSEEVRESVKGNFTSFVTVDMPVIHVDRYTKSQGSLACTGLFTVLLEQYILSKCDVLLLTRSNLGSMSAYMSTKIQDIFIFHHENRTILNISRNAIQEHFKHK